MMATAVCSEKHVKDFSQQHRSHLKTNVIY